MKKVTRNLRFAAIALVAILSLTAATPALAIDGPNPKAIELTFIGNLQNQPLFQLSFNNAEEGEYMVVVMDEYSNVLYKDHVKSSNTTKKFLLNTEELGNVSLRFEITGRKSNKTEVFEINRNSRVVEDMVITKVK